MSISAGHITNNISPNGRMYAGNFSGDGGADLLFVNSYGRIYYFRSVTSYGVRTFWWGFTTYSGQIAADDQVLIANVDGGSVDNIVKRNAATGIYVFLKAEYNGGRLKRITSVDSGHLPQVAATDSVAYFGKIAGYENEIGNQRDDAIVYFKSGDYIKRVDARYSNNTNSQTYWVAYYRKASPMHSGWNDRISYNVGVVNCYRDYANFDPSAFRSDDFIYDIFDRKIPWNLHHYFMDISFGQMDLGLSTIFGDFPITVAPGDSRAVEFDMCVNNLYDLNEDPDQFDRIIAHIPNGNEGAWGKKSDTRQELL